MKLQIAFVLLTLGLFAHAEERLYTPNYYTCKAESLTVVYSTGGFLPHKALTIKDAAGTNAYEGAYVQTTRNPIGLTLSAMTEGGADSYMKWASLILPIVHLSGDAPRIEHDGMLVRTTVKSSFGGPDLVPGVVSHSEYVPVKCTAEVRE